MVEISAQPRKDGWRKFNLPHYGIAVGLDQPCHADVLLELANASEADDA